MDAVSFEIFVNFCLKNYEVKAHNLTKVRRYEKKVILQFTTKRKKDFTYRRFFCFPKAWLVEIIIIMTIYDVIGLGHHFWTGFWRFFFAPNR